MLPVMLNLQDRRVLVVGGGKVATRRVATLLEEGALIEVVASSFSPEILELKENQRLTLTSRAFEPTDVDGAWLVFAHTDTPSVQAQIEQACHERGIWCLVGGEKEKSGFWMMAHRKIQDLTVAVSGGGNPRLAKQTVEKLINFLRHENNTPKPE